MHKYKLIRKKCSINDVRLIEIPINHAAKVQLFPELHKKIKIFFAYVQILLYLCREFRTRFIQKRQRT